MAETKIRPSPRPSVVVVGDGFFIFLFPTEWPQTRNSSDFHLLPLRKRPTPTPALNIIFYRLQTPTSGHSCLMTDIFWAAIEFYFFLYILLYLRFRVSVFFEQHSLSIHNFWKADEKELSAQLVPPSPTVIDRFFLNKNKKSSNLAEGLPFPFIPSIFNIIIYALLAYEWVWLWEFSPFDLTLMSEWTAGVESTLQISPLRQKQQPPAAQDQVDVRVLSSWSDYIEDR